LNVHGVRDVRQTEIHTAELLVLEPSAFEVGLAVEKQICHISPGIDRIQQNLLRRGRTIQHEISKCIISIWNKEELLQEWKEPIIVPNYKKGDKTDCSNYGGI
jgi:hypothetical protein